MPNAQFGLLQLRPSEERLALEQSFAAALIPVLGSFANAQEAEQYQKMIQTSLSMEEQLLKWYTRMKEVQDLIDKNEDPEAEARPRQDMRDLLSRSRTLSFDTQNVMAQVGAMPPLELRRDPKAPIVKEALQSVDSVVFGSLRNVLEP